MDTHRMYHQSSYYNFTRYLNEGSVISMHEMLVRDVRAEKGELSAMNYMFERPKAQLRLASSQISHKNFNRRFSVILSNLRRANLNRSEQVDLSNVVGEGLELKNAGHLVMLGLDVPDSIADEWMVNVEQVDLDYLVGVWTHPELKRYVHRDLVCRANGKYSQIPVYDIPE